MDDVKNLFIGFAKPCNQPQEQIEQKSFFDVLIQNLCEASETKTFQEIFDSVKKELPASSVGSFNTPDFNFKLQFCNEGLCTVLLVFLVLIVSLVSLVLLVLLATIRYG
jgi:hypothetical protein